MKVSVNGGDGQEVKLDGPASKVVKFDGKTVKPGENVFTITGAGRDQGALARVVVSYTRGRSADIPARDHGVKVERTISLRGADGSWSELKSGATRAAGELRQGPRRARRPRPATTINYTCSKARSPAAARRSRPMTRGSAPARTRRATSSARTARR